jgi:hypothetical protein
MNAIVRRLDALSVGKPVNVANTFPVESCSVCASPMHQAQNCPSMIVFAEMEQVNAFNNFQKPSSGPYSETYNPGWRNHPNFSWKHNQPTTNQGGATHPPNHYPPGFSSFLPKSWTFGSASVIIILSSPHSSPSFINTVTGRDHEGLYENDWSINQ